MRSLLLLAALLSACLAHGAEPTSPRRSLTFDLFPTGPRYDSDEDKCGQSLLTLGLCKHDLLASFFAGSPVPLACCHAADEVDDHCGPFTRSFVRSLLPRVQCARSANTGAPTTGSSTRRPPPRAPTLATGPRVSGGTRAPPAQTSARLPPPRAPRGSSGTHAPPAPKTQTSARLPQPRAPKISGVKQTPPPGVYTSVYLPPSHPGRVSPAAQTPPPKSAGGTHAPVASGGAREAGVSGAPAVPVYENAPKPKVIDGGSAGGRTRRAPDVYGPVTGARRAPLAAAPPKGVPTASPSPKSLPYGTPV